MNHYLTYRGQPWCDCIPLPEYVGVVERSGVNWCGSVTLEGAEEVRHKLVQAGLPREHLHIHDGTCPTFLRAYEANDA